MRPLFEVLGRTPASERAISQHGLSAWVADELAARALPVPPQLQVAARSQIASSLKVKRLTWSVLDGFAKVGMVPVLLKGYGLASRLYPAQPLARPASDVDVLVRPDEVPRAEAALTALGLRRRSIPGVAAEHEEHHHFAFVGPPGLVELHFRLLTSFGRGAFDDAAVRARCVRGALDGREVLWLAAEDEFVYLAVHAANHGFLRLSWLVDLARYLERFPALDWSLVFTRAEEAGFRAPLLAALELTERLLGVSLPPPAVAPLQDSRLRRRLHPFVFSLDRVADARWSNDRLASFLLRLYLVDTPAQGLRHLVDGARRYWRQRRGPRAEV